MEVVEQGLEWSPLQSAIFAFVESGKGSAVVEANAGSAKTTTLVECCQRLSEFDNAVVLAFNKRIADELTKRLPHYVPALTLNALGYRAWKRHIGKGCEVDAQKVTALVRSMSGDQNADFKKGVKRLVDLAKMAGIVPSYVTNVTGLRDDTDQNWKDLIYEYAVDFGWADKDDRAIELGRRVLAESIRVGADRIDFNDQLYLPVVFGAEFLTYDIVFVDEAQDISEIQRMMIERSLANSGRLIAVGDPAQAIYHFRGAGRDSMPLLKEKFNAVSLPLSICYRCSRAVVKKAQEFVPQIQACATAVDGLVDENASWTIDSFVSTDVILCRNNAPLVKMAFKLIRSGKACRVMGRDIGSGLIALLKRLRSDDLEELGRKLRRYEDAEVQKAGDNETQRATIADRCATLRVFMENAQSPAEVVTKIETLFSDESGVYLTLSSIHKAKGSEYERVFILDPELIGKRGMTQEERNVFYVGITRAKRELRFIRSV